MASRQVLLLAVVALAVAFLPVLTSAVEYRVGDDAGWTLKYPATNWTNGKTFRVGDALVFTYPKDNHTVTEVGGPAFKSCDTKSNPIKSWNSGNDTVTLDKAGKRWFFCSVADHCTQGLKLVIDVADGNAPAPASPSPSTPAPALPPSSATLNYKVGGAVAQAMVAAGAVIAAMLMF